MKDFNEIKDDVLVSLGKAADAGKDIAGKAADKAKIGIRIAKLSMEIASEKENMKKAYIEIGKLYYDTHKDDPEGFFIQLCEEVSLAQKNIDEKDAAIAELKSKSDEPDVDVEFENIVSQDETDATDAPADCGCCKDDAPAKQDAPKDEE